jgi:hypothetical protein
MSQKTKDRTTRTLLKTGEISGAAERFAAPLLLAYVDPMDPGSRLLPLSGNFYYSMVSFIPIEPNTA